MKRTFILTTMAVFSAALIFTSCKSSRVWATNEKQPKHRTYSNPAPPPRYHNAVSLIISPTPGFVMKQNPNGRYYHVNPRGFMYWKGFDNRFYLDKRYLNDVSYSKWEYNEWKRYSKGKR